MDRKGGEGLGESREQLLKILESIESSLETRAVVAFRRSPETFVREAMPYRVSLCPGHGASPGIPLTQAAVIPLKPVIRDHPSNGGNSGQVEGTKNPKKSDAETL
jgi:hypothetical protein